MDRFGHFEIAQGPDAQPVELLRCPGEFVCLAFDIRVKRLVEFHVVRSAEGLPPEMKRTIFERAQLAAGLGCASFGRVLECGADGDLVYYCTGLNEGEPLERYISRRGALPLPISLSLLMRLLDDLLTLQETPRLLAGLKLDQVFVTLQEETFLQLRVLDLGLSSPEQESSAEDTSRRLVHEICLATFLMLTGRPYAGDDCDRNKVLTALPSGLRSLLRSSLGDGAGAPSSLGRLRDQMRDALTAQTRDLQGRNSRRHLVATDALLPESSLREVLLHDVRMEQLIKGRLVAAHPDAQQRYPFTFQGADARTGAPLNVHLLPPRRIVSNEHYDAVPLQMWRCDAEKHPNILRSLGAWESPDLTFLTEEHSPGVPLSRLIAERVYLNPTEVAIILRQVKAGLDQALECGVEKLDIHPCNIFLKLGSALPAREMEKLLQKRLDVWPKFTVMLRPHMTMRSLYEPLLVDDEVAEMEDGFFDARDFTNRSYVVLAGYLLSGERQVSGRQRLPDSLPDQLVAFITESTAQSRLRGATPPPEQFLAAFEKCALGPEVAPRGGAQKLPERGSVPRAAVPPAAAVVMESAGSVSDFDEDQHEAPAPVPTPVGAKPVATPVLPPVPRIGGAELRRVRRFGWVLFVAVVLVVAWIAYAVLASGRNEASHVEALTPRKSAVVKKPPSTNQLPPADEPPQWRSTIKEEVRRALVPSSREKEELLKKQQGPSSSNCVAPPTAQAALRFFQGRRL